MAVLGCTAPLPGAPSESPPTGPRSRAGCASSPAWLWAVSRLVCRQNARLGHLLLVRLKVLLVEVVYPDVAVLAAGGVRAAVRREGERVDGAEVASDAAELLPEGVVEEERLELALLRGGRRDGHGVLPSSGDEVRAVGQRRDGGRVERPLRVEGVEEAEGLGLEEADELVGAGGAEERLVVGELEVGDLLGVHPLHDVLLLP
mmetsp:Transcript_28302/g.84553  ORF Transcript_28302/g.84553 Transcript_28302/m.84553 type:complete len:203 (+) Transcript_28302:100-708(+)